VGSSAAIWSGAWSPTATALWSSTTWRPDGARTSAICPPARPSPWLWSTRPSTTRLAGLADIVPSISSPLRYHVQAQNFRRDSCRGGQFV